MKFFFLSAHNKPSGGTKVINQIVNLCREKGYKSYLVTIEDKPKKADFLNNPCGVFSLKDFKNQCKKEDIVIDCWQHKLSYQAVRDCISKTKIFWQHGTLIPVYPNFNGEEIFKPGIYSQYWNASQKCANFIKNKYNFIKISVIHPFFDDEILLKYTNYTNKRDGMLLVRRRGQEVIPSIINSFPEQKITILNTPFTDKQLYQELIRHKYFVTCDNGLHGKLLIKNKYERFFRKAYSLKNNFLKSKKWIKHKTNYLGFPMTACEAAWLNTTVIGFAMGGGLEWMNNDNMYLAKDSDINSLLAKIKEATEDSEKNLEIKRKNAFEAVSRFNKKNTWNQLTRLLNL